MNPEMYKSALRSIIIGMCCLVAGWFAAKGYISGDTVSAVMNSEFFGAVVGALVTAAWGAWTKTKPNLLVTAANVTDDHGNKLVTEMKVTDPKIARQVNSQVDASVTLAVDSLRH